MNPYYPNLLLVAGTGRNVGKTSLICKVIKSFKTKNSLIAIKLTTHLHTLQTEIIPKKIMYQNQYYKIFNETINSDKDSGRFYQSGAEKVIYIETKTQFVLESFLKTMEILPENSIILCESGSLRDYILPGLFILVKGNNIKDMSTFSDRIQKADLIFDSTDVNCIFDISRIGLLNSNWKLNN